MQEVKILRWCDACHQESGTLSDVRARYQVSVMTVGGSNQPLVRVLELCDVHAKVVEDVREMMRSCGQPVGANDVEPEQPELPLADDKYQWRTKRRDCPMCGKSLSDSGVRYHLVSSHGAKKIVQPKRCPDCAYKSDNALAMGAHRAQAHRYSIITDMVARHEAKAKP